MSKINVFNCLMIFVLVSAGCEEQSGEAIKPISEKVHFAVVSTNYIGATSIALLNGEGEVIDDRWLGSYTANPDLRTPLTEDVALPTVSASRRYLTTLERGIGVVSRFDLNDGSVLGQVRTDSSSEDNKAAYHSNPQDVYYVNDGSAWISRWQPNLEVDASDKDTGNDLIEIDPGKMERKNRRIALSDFNETIKVPVYDKDYNVIGEEDAVAYARPSGLVGAGDYLVVGLSRLTSDWEPGSGLVVIVDPIKAKVTDSVKIEGLKNCGDLRPVVGADDRVLVQCSGKWDDRGASAGIAIVKVESNGKGTIVENWRVSDHKGAANTQSGTVSLGGTTVVAAEPGERDANTGKVSKTDTLYLVDLSTGKQTKIFSSEGAFSIGNGAYDPGTSVLLIPDAGKDESPSFYGVRLFKVDADGKLSEPKTVEIAPDLLLPVRYVYLL